MRLKPGGFSRSMISPNVMTLLMCAPYSKVIHGASFDCGPQTPWHPFRMLQRWLCPAVVDIQDRQALQMCVQSRLKIGIVFDRGQRPGDLGVGRRTRVGHVLKVLGVRYILRPELRLRAKDVSSLIDSQFR